MNGSFLATNLKTFSARVGQMQLLPSTNKQSSEWLVKPQKRSITNCHDKAANNQITAIATKKGIGMTQVDETNMKANSQS
jgi:hypothetical protein